MTDAQQWKALATAYEARLIEAVAVLQSLSLAVRQSDQAGTSAALLRAQTFLEVDMKKAGHPKAPRF